ncbi:MAG: tol-pal system protein YbgF [Proteobacteria bacterium]|nr:tol-pal system protein YbgF [Pseudomonadota bacterium]
MVSRRVAMILAMAAATVVASGCVTVAEHRKLERRVIDMERARSGSDPRQNLADVSVEVDVLESELRELRGRMEVVERTAADAMAEARKARTEAAVAPGTAPVAVAGMKPPMAGDSPPAQGADSTEVAEYRSAYAAWRADDHAGCIDQFRSFLQTYAASAYADDAAFWMADCHFKQGDFKNAVLRFDDVVRNYPTGNKAPDALYRQGESLLKLGPGFHQAAKRAFERVIVEYPDSARAQEADQQIELLAKG